MLRTFSSDVMSISLNRRSGRPRQHREHPRLVRRLEKRDRESAANGIGVAGRVAGSVVSVEGHLDRAGAAVVGHTEPADLGHLGLREPDGREDRLVLRADDRDRGVRGGLLAGQLEDADDARVIRRLDRRSVSTVRPRSPR